MGYDDEMKKPAKEEKSAAEAAREAYDKRAAQQSTPARSADSAADKAAAAYEKRAAKHSPPPTEADKVTEAYEKRAAKHSVPGREKKAESGDLAEHTVESGDTLSHIAKRFYGSADNWKAIYAANKAQIGDNPNQIRVGQKLRIPRLDA